MEPESLGKSAVISVMPRAAESPPLQSGLPQTPSRASFLSAAGGGGAMTNVAAALTLVVVLVSGALAVHSSLLRSLVTPVAGADVSFSRSAQEAAASAVLGAATSSLPAVTNTVGMATSSQPITYVYTYPVIERIVSATSSGVTEGELTSKLNQLDNKLASEILSVSASLPGSSGSSAPLSVQQFAPSQRINQLSGVTITNSTIDTASIPSLSGSYLSITNAGNATLSGTLTAGALALGSSLNFTGVNSTTTLLRLDGEQLMTASSTINSYAFGLDALGSSSPSVSDEIALGTQALFNDVSGTDNNALGFESLFSNTTGTDNNALGKHALEFNTIGTDNNALGHSALVLNTTGTDNNALGFESLFSNTTGTDNNALGYSALFNNTTGINNNALGSSALGSNTTGTDNNALGFQALDSNTTGTDNNALGFRALLFNTTGINNNALGNTALEFNTTGINNNALGNTALKSNTTGSYNNAFGYQTLLSNTTGVDNNALGGSALANNTTGSENNALGDNALWSNTTGSENNALGLNVLYSNTTGSNNSALGNSALTNNTTGSENNAFGDFALTNNTTGTYNNALGNNALTNNTTGYDNIQIGHVAHGGGSNVTTGYNNILFGYDIVGTSSASTNFLNIGNLLFGTLPATSTYAGSTLKLPTSGAIGIGTSSPFAKFSIHANNGDTATTLFAIGSSTASATSTLFVVNNQGNVGIGTSSPASLFTLVGGGACFSGSGATLACGNAAGNLYYRTANTGTYDVAEKYQTGDASLSPGDVVALDTTTARAVKRASGDTPILGIVSSDPGLLLGGADANAASGTVAVALSGRVPVKVSLEGGTIAIGDELSLSSAPGVAKKASVGEATIGYALESFNGPGAGVVDVFVTHGTFAGASMPWASGAGQSGMASLFSAIAQWLADAGNGIADLFAGSIHAQQKLCVGSTCVTPEQFAAMAAAAGITPSAGSVSGASSTPSQSGAPVIAVQGDNPAHIDVGSSYADLGALITGPTDADKNLGIHAFVDGAAVDVPLIDTSAPGTHTIDYVATNASGTATTTRTVIVGNTQQATSTPAAAPDTAASSTEATNPGADTASSTNAASTN